MFHKEKMIFDSIEKRIGGFGKNYEEINIL